jgi:NAD(P)-dependent dehydrogenase (short-subunit alcohol dehydrogenase family)
MDSIWIEVAKLGASIIAILVLAWMAKRMGLGGDVRIRDEAHARALAEEAICDFQPIDIVIDKAGLGALMKDAAGRHLLIRRHGAQFASRLLDGHAKSRLDQNFLTIGTGEKTFGKITLNLGSEAQYWAAGLRHMAV